MKSGVTNLYIEKKSKMLESAKEIAKKKSEFNFPTLCKINCHRVRRIY